MNRYVFLFVIISLLNVLITKKSDRKFSNPSIAFSVLWTFIVFLSSMRLLYLRKTPDQTYDIILIGTICFVVGCHIANVEKVVHQRQNNVSKVGTVSLRYDLLCCMAVICIVYYLPSLAKSIINMMNGMSLNDVRSGVQEGEYSTGLSNFIPNFVVMPAAIALEPLAVADFWFGKRKKNFIILTMILVVVRTLGDGGRTPFFNMVLYFIIGYVIKTQMEKKSRQEKYNNRETTKKDRKKFKRITLLGVLSLAILTLMRTANTLFRKLYFYFAMAPILCSRWQSIVLERKYCGKGMVSLNGAFYLIDYFRKNFTQTQYFKPIIDAYNMIALTDSSWQNIAPTTTANAYVSCFWFFWTDGRLLGVILFSAIFGFFVTKAYKNMFRNESLKEITIYLILYQGVFFSFIRFPFSKSYYVIAILIIYVLAFKRNRKIVQQY